LKPDMDLVPTASQTVGPFFKIELTTDEHCVNCIAGQQSRGERLWIRFRVLDGDGVPVNDAMLEIWQADANGKYNHPDDLQPKKVDPGWIGFGRLATGEDGSCVLETIKPGRVEQNGAAQAPHLLLAVFARGMLKQLYTRVYFSGDAANDADSTLQLVPADRRKTLMARPDPNHSGYWLFDVRLQGDQETVFFDV
jgi:protocatechuate 3,4-dioxygenase, alpha subunit